MKVKELIDNLKLFDPNTFVTFKDPEIGEYFAVASLETRTLESYERLDGAKVPGRKILLLY